jgi:hypothetical protein
MVAFYLRLLAYRLLKPRPLSNGVLFERQNKTIIIIIIIIITISQQLPWAVGWPRAGCASVLARLFRQASAQAPAPDIF